MIMREGKLVPTELTVRLLRAAMQRNAATKFLIDGFPRALDQAHLFEQDIKPPDLVIYLDCPQARAALFRALSRRPTAASRRQQAQHDCCKFVGVTSSTAAAFIGIGFIVA